MILEPSSREGEEQEQEGSGKQRYEELATMHANKVMCESSFW